MKLQVNLTLPAHFQKFSSVTLFACISILFHFEAHSQTFYLTLQKPSKGGINVVFFIQVRKLAQRCSMPYPDHSVTKKLAWNPHAGLPEGEAHSLSIKPTAALFNHPL